MTERLSGDDDGLGGLRRQGGAWLMPNPKARLTTNLQQSEEGRAPDKETQLP